MYQWTKGFTKKWQHCQPLKLSGLPTSTLRYPQKEAGVSGAPVTMGSAQALSWTLMAFIILLVSLPLDPPQPLCISYVLGCSSCSGSYNLLFPLQYF